MSNEPIDDVPDFYQPEDLNRLIRNLAEAGWFEGNQFVNGEGFSIHYSPRGLDRMRAMIPVIKRIAPSVFGGIPATKTSPLNVLIFAAEVFLIAPELVGKIQTTAEGNALVALIASFAIKNGGDLPPNPRGASVLPLPPNPPPGS